MDSMMTGVLVVAGAAALALILRATSRGDEEVGQGTLSGSAPVPAPGDSTAAGPGEPSVEPDEDEAGDEVASVASNGWMFMPFAAGVRLWAPAGESADPGEAPAQRAAEMRPAATLSAGDLIAARVVAGGPGEEPCRVEALGRDREFSAWEFETEEAARAACELLERLVVRVPLGPDGEPEPVGDGEIAEARRIVEETVRELEAGSGAEEPEEPKA